MSAREALVAGVAWTTSRDYPSRAHITPQEWTYGLCGLPVSTLWPERPHGFRVCPECAIAWVSSIFPASPPSHPAATPLTSGRSQS